MVTLNSKSIFKNESCEIYEYRHYNQLKRRENPLCPFCNPESDRELIVESATAFAIFDKFPVSNGHALIIPKKHNANYFELSLKEQYACILMLNTLKQIISNKFKPNGFNVGININEVAGQTIHHVHIHLIPRYIGDVKEPRGGVKALFPIKKITNTRLTLITILTIALMVLRFSLCMNTRRTQLLMWPRKSLPEFLTEV